MLLYSSILKSFNYVSEKLNEIKYEHNEEV